MYQTFILRTGNPLLSKLLFNIPYFTANCQYIRLENRFNRRIQKMKAMSDVFPTYFNTSAFGNSFKQILPVTHLDQKSSEKDLTTSMKYILEQIQNIKYEVQKDKFDSFIDKTMLVSSDKENSLSAFSKKCIKNEFNFSKNYKLRVKKKFQTNIRLPLQQEKVRSRCITSQVKLSQNLYPISCNHLENTPYYQNTSRYPSYSSINSRTLQRSRIRNFIHPTNTSSLKIEDFELGQMIGSGKFGDVHLCRHKATNWIFALKKILKSTILQYKMMTQFINELKIQYRLDHPNIVKLYAHFSDQYHIFLLMEYAPGGTLMKKLKSSEQYASNVLQQSLQAIKYAHMNHIIHRDIKPQNIVLFFDDTFKLCDFGLSTYLGHHHDIKTSFCGTLDYIAPEMKDIGVYGYSIDIWGLGILTYQLLIGEAPFKEQISNWKKKGGKINNVWNWKINYPHQLSENAVQFMKNLLKQNPNERVSIAAALMSNFIKQKNEKVVVFKEYEVSFLKSNQSCE